MNMELNDTEKAICRATGVTEAQYVNAKAKRSPYPDHKPDDFDDNRGGGREVADAGDPDGGIPATSDDSVWAHAKRALNQLEAAMDGDEVDMDRVAAARECLSRAIERRGGMRTGPHGVRFVR
jgi:hypothetical protein